VVVGDVKLAVGRTVSRPVRYIARGMRHGVMLANWHGVLAFRLHIMAPQPITSWCAIN